MSCPYIIIRYVPHYRVELFRQLNRHYGLKIIVAETVPSDMGLKLCNDEVEDIIVRAPFVFPNPQDSYNCSYAVDWILENLRPETLISEFGLRQSSAFSLPLARRRGRFKKLAFWTHGWMMERGFRRPVDLASQAARLIPYAAADTIATYTAEGAAWVRKMLPWKEVVVLENALDTREIRAAAAAASPVRHGAPQLLAIGRMLADKQFDRVIEVWRQVRAQLPDATLTLIGDGPERPRLETQIGADLGGAVQMTGALYGETALAPHFLGADALVLAGAAGFSVNHASAYALPVVAFPRSPHGPFHHPEIQYVVDDYTGLFVQEYSDRAMADAIVAAYRSGALDRMRRAMTRNPPGPTIDDMVRNFAKVI